MQKELRGFELNFMAEETGINLAIASKFRF